MTSKIRGSGEKRDNRTHSRLRCTRISPGLLMVKTAPLTITSGMVFGEINLKNKIYMKNPGYSSCLFESVTHMRFNRVKIIILEGPSVSGHICGTISPRDLSINFFRGHYPGFPIWVGEVLPDDRRNGVSSDLQNKRLILKADLLLDRWSRAGFHET